jgi:hypothetical protein
LTSLGQEAGQMGQIVVGRVGEKGNRSNVHRAGSISKSSLMGTAENGRSGLFMIEIGGDCWITAEFIGGDKGRC